MICICTSPKKVYNGEIFIMRNFSKALISFFLLFFFVSSSYAAPESTLISIATPTPAVEYSLPYPGLLPDHPLYLLKALRDRILLFFAPDEIRKSQLNLLFADKRLAMGQLLWEKGNSTAAITTFTKAEKYLLSTAINLTVMKKQNGLPPGLADKVGAAAKKHEEIISQLLTTAGDDIKKQGLNEALGINHQAIQQILSVK